VAPDRSSSGYLGEEDYRSFGNEEVAFEVTIFPDHGAKEMGEGLRKKILKDLGLSE